MITANHEMNTAIPSSLWQPLQPDPQNFTVLTNEFSWDEDE